MDYTEDQSVIKKIALKALDNGLLDITKLALDRLNDVDISIKKEVAQHFIEALQLFAQNKDIEGNSQLLPPYYQQHDEQLGSDAFKHLSQVQTALHIAEEYGDQDVIQAFF